jgi:ferric-dicitrate binding protein FerR (iron transport regulator)
VEGKIKLVTPADDNAVLSPGEQGRVDDEGKMTRQPVDVHLYTAWKEGDFIFRKQRLEEITRAAARWYNIEVSFADEASKEITFSGRMRRYDGFNKFAAMLESTGSVKFSVEGTRVVISKNIE